MSLNKIKSENLINEKRNEINKLNNKINRLKEEINQIEVDNLITSKKPLENNRKYEKVIQLFRKKSNKEEVKFQF